MKILYYSDSYAYNVMGTKRSIFEEIKSRGISIVWKDKSIIGKVLQHIGEVCPTQIWLAGSDIVLSSAFKNHIKIPIIAFGFSDPFMFNIDRLVVSDIYVTNYHNMLNRHKHSTRGPLVYNQTACDFRFHKKINLPKKYDITITGQGYHGRFKNHNERINIVDRLRKDGFDVWAFGNGWPKHPQNKPHIEGEEFLNVINSTKICLDLAESNFPLAHRMFEYSACGVPVITKNRQEVFSFFSSNEIRTYEGYDDLKFYLTELLEGDKYIEVGNNALKRCKKDHNISNRVDYLLYEIKELL